MELMEALHNYQFGINGGIWHSFFFPFTGEQTREAKDDKKCFL